MPPVLALPIKLLRSWLPGADLASSTTGLKTADSRRTWEKTIRSSSTSSSRQPNDNHPNHLYPGCTSPDGDSHRKRNSGNWILLHSARPHCWSTPVAWPCAEFSLSTYSVLHGRQLHPAISADAFDVGSGRLCDLPGTSFGGRSQLEQRHQHRAYDLPTGQSTKLLSIPGFRSGASYATTNGNSYYHSLQTKVEKQFASGLNFLATYTFSKTMTDAGDLLNGGSSQGFRAPDVPGAGIHYDYGLASFDIRNVFHFSGGYELPFGKGKRYMASILGSGERAGRRLERQLERHLAGWPTDHPSLSLGHSSGDRCYDLLVKGQSPKLGLHTDSNGAAELVRKSGSIQPALQVGSRWTPDPTSVPGCSALTGLGALGGPPTQIAGPPFQQTGFLAL